MADEMFDGFDHTQYKDEVERRWGKDAYAGSDAWWRGLGSGEKAEWRRAADQLARDWTAAAQRGLDPGSAEAQVFAPARRLASFGPGHPGGA